MSHILIGRKAICAYLGVCWTTVRKWIKKRDLPVLQEEGCPPSLHTAELEEWHRKRRCS